MGKVTQALVDLIAKQVRDHGIVVWYDPEKVYVQVAESLRVEDATVICFRDSFFALRHEIERFFEFVRPDGGIDEKAASPPRIVVYVPRGRRESQHALVEAESAGTVMEPGANPWQRNTRLGLIAKRLFQKVAPGRADKIEIEVNEGRHNLAELDRLAEEASGLGSGVLELIFGRVSPVDVVLQFAASSAYDAAIESKSALAEIADVVRAELGLEIGSAPSVPAARTEVRRWLFRGDLVATMSDGEPLKRLFSGRVPRDEEVHTAQRICRDWRNRTDLRESYVDAAHEVDREFGLGGLDLKAEALVEVETLPFVERKLLEHAEWLALEGRGREALDLATQRKGRFWSLQEPANGLRWSLLETVCQLFLAAQRLQRGLGGVKQAPTALVKAYTEGEEPWCELDTLHRHLERQYADFDVGVGEEHDDLQKVVARARQEYGRTVNRSAEEFQQALEAAEFDVKEFLHQDKVFPKLVAGSVRSSGRGAVAGPKDAGPVAYVLVDALRYEMARELVRGLERDFEIELEPVIAQVPTITEVGMAALVPGSDLGMELVEGAAGKVAVKIGSATLRDRATRMAHLREHLREKWGLDPERVIDLKLNDVIKPTKKTQERIAEASLVVVTSQEIDRRGEDGEDEDEVHRLMSEVLEKLRRGIRRLAALGVRRLVVAADHGHLFIEHDNSGALIDAPGGRTVDLHRRVWVGEGGSSSASHLRVHASQVGLGGALELVFARGAACFKARGGSSAFFHGGISLQEVVVPALVLTPKAPFARGGRSGVSTQDIVRLTMEKPSVTTRFFTVKVECLKNDMFKGEPKRVVVEVRAGKERIGDAVAAVYGFEEGTREVLLEMGRANVVTLRINHEVDAKAISVNLIDAVSQIELHSLSDVPLRLAL